MMSLFGKAMVEEAEALLRQLRARHLKLATAESCTGGLIAALVTEVAGSSDVFTHGFVVYANEAKSSMLGIPAPLIKVHGAVSEKVAIALAEDALRVSGADVAVATTGIAGPGGATKDKPVGLVHLACARKDFSTLHTAAQFSGDRATVRLQAVQAALELVQRQLVR